MLALFWAYWELKSIEYNGGIIGKLSSALPCSIATQVIYKVIPTYYDC